MIRKSKFVNKNFQRYFYGVYIPQQTYIHAQSTTKQNSIYFLINFLTVCSIMSQIWPLSWKRAYYLCIKIDIKQITTQINCSIICVLCFVKDQCIMRQYNVNLNMRDQVSLGKSV